MHPNHQYVEQYEALTQLATDEIKAMKTSYPDFSIAGLKIDDLVEEEYLENIDPEVVLLVAYEMGFEIYICNAGLGHNKPLVKANGKWIEPPSWVKYNGLEQRVCCPHCETESELAYKKTGLTRRLQ